MYCARTARQATPQECHETIAQTTDSALYSTCRACAHGQRLMATVQWAKEEGADASPAIYNDTEKTIMTKKTTQPANFAPATKPKKTTKPIIPTTAVPATSPAPETTAQTSATEDRAGTPTPAETKTYTIIDLCERTQLPYGTVYGAVRDLKRGKPATSASQQTVKEALKTMRIGAADLVPAPKGKKPKDSPLDELAAAQALAAAVTPASPQEARKKKPAFVDLFPTPFTKGTVQTPAPGTEHNAPSADPQPDEGDPDSLDQAVDEVAKLTAMPSPNPLPLAGNMPKYTGKEFEFFRNHTDTETSTEQAVIKGINTLHRALSLHELPLEDLLAELRRRIPHAEVVVRIGPAAA